MTEINPSWDWLEIVNWDENSCSWNLTISWNLRYKTKFSTTREINNFLLSWKSIAILAKDCSYFSGKTCFSFNKNIRIFDDVNLKYNLYLNWNFLTWYLFSSGQLIPNSSGSLSLLKTWRIRTGASPWIFNFLENTNNSENKLTFYSCWILKENSWYNYHFKLSGNFNPQNKKFKRYLNNNFLTSSNNLKINLYSWNYLIKWEIFSWNIKLCETYYEISKIVKKNTINIFSWTLKISEIHPIDDDLPEYIEITAIWNWSGQVTIKWLWRWTSSKTFSLTLFSWQTAIITDSTWWFEKYNIPIDKIILLSSISLTNNWEQLTIIDNSGHILDKVYYINWKKWKSLYFSWTLSWDTRIFNHIDILTPVLKLENIKPYLQNQKFNTGVEFYIKIQNTSSFYFWKSVNLIAVFSWKELQNNEKNFECKWFISWNLVFTWCNPYYYKFNNSWIIPIKLELLDKTNNFKYITYSYINYPSLPSCNCNCWSCRENYYHNLYLKRKNKYYKLKKIQKEIKNKSKSIENKYIPLTWTLQIYSILPNPKWKDKNKEVIKILALKNLNLNWIFIKYWKNKKFFLSWEIKNGQILTLTGDFKFSNKWDCIYLLSGNFLLDKLCYIKPKSWKFILRQDGLHLDIETNKILSNLTLKQKEDKFCLYYQKKEINCKKIQIKKIDEYKSLKKSYKNLEKEHKNLLKKIKICTKKIIKIFRKLQKQIKKKNNDIKKLNTKIIKLESKIQKLTSNYKKLKNDFKMKKERIKNSCKKQKEKLKQQKEYYKNLYQKLKQKYNIVYQKYKLYKNFANIQKTIIKNKRKPIREKEWLNNIEQAVKTLDAYINSWFTEITIKWIKIKPYEIKLYTKIKNNPLYDLIYKITNSSKEIDYFFNNLNKSLQR